MEQKSLGMMIREERKKKGLTQAQLGKLIGLKEARVSKIEHGAPITPEVASFILGKMGSTLQIKVVGSNDYDHKMGPFVIWAISNFADEKGLSLAQAYRYILTFKGLDFLHEHHDIEQTLGRREVVDDLLRVCAHHGGRL